MMQPVCRGPALADRDDPQRVTARDFEGRRLDALQARELPTRRQAGAGRHDHEVGERLCQHEQRGHIGSSA